ncbi:ArsR/SmtB family transcription factor [Streptomyces sp. ADI95-16]|uniref:ArsR/SmtB family transcription factor n=1 Tax=Streptomyces sp. ADI95-16 TaxID=1522758 RepID=UPI00349FC126
MLDHAAATFALLASSTRLHIMWVLAESDSDVSSLGARVGRALPTISQHLTQLKMGGLVHARREGRRHVYSIRDPRVLTIVKLMIGQLSEGPRPETAPAQY